MVVMLFVCTLLYYLILRYCKEDIVSCKYTVGALAVADIGVPS